MRRSKPVIAAVNGHALAGGFELVLACDLAVALDTAEFGLPEVARGLIAGAGGLIRLPRQLPPKRAMELILLGTRLTAPDAFRYGIVNRLAGDREGVLPKPRRSRNRSAVMHRSPYVNPDSSPSWHFPSRRRLSRARRQRPGSGFLRPQTLAKGPRPLQKSVSPNGRVLKAYLRGSEPTQLRGKPMNSAWTRASIEPPTRPWWAGALLEFVDHRCLHQRCGSLWTTRRQAKRWSSLAFRLPRCEPMVHVHSQAIFRENW